MLPFMLFVSYVSPDWVIGLGLSLMVVNLGLFLLHLAEVRKWRQWASPVRLRWLIWTVFGSWPWLLLLMPGW